MAKKLPSPAEMKAAVEAFKKQFTGGFYHGSPSPNIKAFDSSKNPDNRKLEVPGVTFVTRDPDFAESFLPMKMTKPEYETGATMYPVSVNLGKHWNPGTPEGKQVVKDYMTNVYKQDEWSEPNLVKKGLFRGDWGYIEDPMFLQHLQDMGHDSFHVMEGGIPNVGIFNPKNIRGKFAKFNPEDADSPDFMKAEGGAVEGYAPGGKIGFAKKALEHARSVPFVHFSNKSDLMHLDPNMYGTGIKGKESARLKSAPDIRPRSYIYTDRPDVRPEQGLGSHKYSGVAEDMYPLHEDPAGFSAIAKTKAIDPYMMSMGREVIDQPTHLNELERLIKAAGYKGYANDDVGLLFHPTEVKKVSGPEHFASGGMVGAGSLLSSVLGNSSSGSLTTPPQVGSEQGPVPTENPYAGQPVDPSVYSDDFGAGASAGLDALDMTKFSSLPKLSGPLGSIAGDGFGGGVDYDQHGMGMFGGQAPDTSEQGYRQMMASAFFGPEGPPSYDVWKQQTTNAYNNLQAARAKYGTQGPPGMMSSLPQIQTSSTQMPANSPGAANPNTNIIGETRTPTSQNPNMTPRTFGIPDLTGLQKR